MKILQVHNFYRWPGGEDQVCAAEYKLLTARGHQVKQYFVHNDAIKHAIPIDAGIRTIWNHHSFRELRTVMRRESPDIVHAHNTFPLVSPALYYAAAAERVPVVQTLHNYRLLCAGGTFFRNGRICEACLGSALPYRAVVHGCYRNSHGASAATAAMLFVHRVAGTWENKIETYIAITTGSRNKFVEGGLPSNKIVVKPNFLADDPGMGDGSGGFALFLGRLSEEKGLDVLLNAWRRLGRIIPLRIAGDGPLAGWLKEQLPHLPNVAWLNHCSHETAMRLLQRAAFLVVPSRCLEQLPMAIVEASACGTPVVASALGSMDEVVIEGINGVCFKTGDSDDLLSKVHKLLADEDNLKVMRRSARLNYERNYTAERNYELLMDIYANTIRRNKGN